LRAVAIESVAPGGARQAYGVPSGVNNRLIINKAVIAGRITAILMNESLGF
jgi:hypothetical protein